MYNLRLLADYNTPPDLYAGLDNAFWIDPHIASQMLLAHLDPTTEAASYPPDQIEATIAWLTQQLGVTAGMRLLDLGCGPGLYTRRWAAQGLQVTGVDFSQVSLLHACQHDPHSTYYCQNYLELALDETFDVVTLISRDFCALTPAQSEQLLDVVRRHLKGGGAFVLDVTTRYQHISGSSTQAWSAYPDGGFWSADPHLLLMHHYERPDVEAVLDQYIIVYPDGRVQAHHNWLHYYSAESITAVLEGHGFRVEGLYSDLRGTPLDDAAPVIGVVARY